MEVSETHVARYGETLVIGDVRAREAGEKRSGNCRTVGLFVELRFTLMAISSEVEVMVKINVAQG